MSTTRVVFVIGASIGAAILLSWAGPAPGAAAAGPAVESSFAALQAADSVLYFPPAGEPWETVDPAAAGWDAERIEAALAGATVPTQRVTPSRTWRRCRRAWSPSWSAWRRSAAS